MDVSRSEEWSEEQKTEMATAINQDAPDTIFTAVDAPFETALLPDPDLNISEWADQYRVLSRVSAGEPGRWRTSRTPFLREIMDCLSPSSPFSRVVFVKPAQIGGSELLLNMLGYIIHYAPGPAMLVQPTVELAKRFSRQRIASLIENTPGAGGARLRSARARLRQHDSGEGVSGRRAGGDRRQQFRRPAVDAGAVSADGRGRCVPAVGVDRRGGHRGRRPGRPGHPAHRRRSPTGRSPWSRRRPLRRPAASRQAYQESDQRKYYVPCPHCGAFQVLRWAQVKWPERKPAEAWYECERCHEHIADHHKPEMLARGRVARRKRPGDGETAGFWLNGLYSPWTTWGQLAKDFLRARKSPERMQTFTNTVLAETFQQAGTMKTDASELLARRQPYRPESSCRQAWC